MIIDVKKLVKPLEDGSVPIKTMFDMIPEINDLCKKASHKVKMNNYKATLSVANRSSETKLELHYEGKIALRFQFIGEADSEHIFSFNQWPLYEYMIKHGLINLGETE